MAYNFNFFEKEKNNCIKKIMRQSQRQDETSGKIYFGKLCNGQIKVNKLVDRPIK